MVLAGFEGTGRPRHDLPFADAVPGFFDYLAEERGLRPASILAYRHHLSRFEAYLIGVGVDGAGAVADAAERVRRRTPRGGLAKTTVRDTCGVLRVFLRYAHREGVLRQGPERHGGVAAGLPAVRASRGRSRGPRWTGCSPVWIAAPRAGKRDYAILLLLVSYGLRGREVAALTLDDIDWKRERLAVPERKAGHSTAFPLSAVVGAALVDYLQHGRPATQRPARVLPRGGAGPADRGGRGVRPAPATTCSRPVSRCPGRDRTRCATPACSVWSTPTSR